MPSTRKLTIVAQDPSVRTGKAGRILTAEVDIPHEDVTGGPRGYRVHVIDYDATSDTLYQPLAHKAYRAGDPFQNPTNHTILTDPAFHSQNVYAIVMRTLARFEHVLGRRVGWSFNGHQLHVAPHAFSGANAFYSKKDRLLAFGYFPAISGKEMVFSCLAHDVIVHETVHALLDGLRERYTDPSSPDQAAFHEGFADVIALLSAFSIPEVAGAALPGQGNDSIARADLHADRLRAGILFGLAEQMGGELSGVRGDPLRRSVEMKPSTAYLAMEEYNEPHRRGEIFAAAMMNAFLNVWSKRLAGLGDRTPDGAPGKGPLSRSRAMEEGALAAGRLMKIAIRALDYAPVVDILFGDFLSAALTADHELVSDDSMYGFRRELRDSFAAYGIPPTSINPRAAEPGLWDRPEKEAVLDYSNTHFESMQQDPDEVFRFIWENRDSLRIFEQAYTEVLSVRPCRRIGPDGFILHETVAEYRQILSLEARELAQLNIRKPAGMKPAAQVRLFGGGALIFDEYGRLKFHVRSRVDSRRQQKRLDYLWETGAFDSGASSRNNFAQLHLDRGSVWPLGLQRGEEF